jgi:predicted lipoprotein with Yx(FWY)xxD motif
MTWRIGACPRKVPATFGVLVDMNYYGTSWKKRSALALIAPVVVAVAIAGCGGGGGGKTSSSNSASSATAKTAVSSGLTLRLAHLEPGKALVDAQGRTLYLFEADKSDKSTCNGACASLWPPATVTGTPKAGPGLTANEIGTTKRSDGESQLTYNGHPLYRYAADGKPGEDNGQGLNQFGAKWYVLNPSGSKIDDD